MSGILNVLVGIGGALLSSSITCGPGSGSVGYNISGSGSISNSSLKGRDIWVMLSTASIPQFYFSVSGTGAASNLFASININGFYLRTADAVFDPNANGNSSSWLWPTSVGLVGSTTYGFAIR